MNLLAAIILFESLAFCTGQEITSTGEHSSEEFTWAVGFNNLRFNISFSGLDSSTYGSYNHVWSHVWDNGTTIVSFQTGVFSFNPVGVSCYYGDSFNNPPTHTAYGVDYRIDCTLIGSTLETQFSILSPLSDSYNGTSVKVEREASYNFMRTKKLQLEYCNKLEGSGYLSISGGSNAKYGNNATYTCSDSALVVSGTYNKNVNTYSRTCDYDAEWSGQGSEVDCWFAPNTSISIEQNGKTSTGTLISEDSCTINCIIVKPGNPFNVTAKYYKDKTQISSNTFSVTSDDNGALVSCQTVNTYVNEVNNSAGFSKPMTLNVLFQPEPLNGDQTQQQYAGIAEEYTMMILFNANPRIYISNTDLYFDGKLLDTSNASISYSGTRHEYRYSIVNVNKTNFGTYILSTRSSSPLLTGRVSNFTVALNFTAPFSTTTIPQSTPLCIESGLSTAAVAAISTCVGIVVGIIATSAVWWWMLKRASKGSMSDGKKEPAYEPTYVGGQLLESAYEVVNRETIEDNVRVATQEQTNVNSAYEVIR